MCKRNVSFIASSYPAKLNCTQSVFCSTLVRGHELVVEKDSQKHCYTTYVANALDSFFRTPHFSPYILDLSWHLTPFRLSHILDMCVVEESMTCSACYIAMEHVTNLGGVYWLQLSTARLQYARVKLLHGRLIRVSTLDNKLKRFIFQNLTFLDLPLPFIKNLEFRK